MQRPLRHVATPGFRQRLGNLPPHVQDVAHKNYQLLRRNPRHPSVRLKKVGRHWSARVGSGHRALAVEAPDGALVWWWIGPHDAYERLLADR